MSTQLNRKYLKLNNLMPIYKHNNVSKLIKNLDKRKLNSCCLQLKLIPLILNTYLNTNYFKYIIYNIFKAILNVK